MLHLLYLFIKMMWPTWEEKYKDINMEKYVPNYGAYPGLAILILPEEYKSRIVR